MKTRTKVLITLASVAAVGFAAYSGVWFYYKNNIWQPHIDQATVKLTAKHHDDVGCTEYCYTDEETKDNYMFKLPDFGDFSCTVSTVSAYFVDLDETYINFFGEERNPVLMGSGAELGGCVKAWLDKNGQIAYYLVSFGPAGQEETEKYAEQGDFLLGPDGALWNEDELNDKEYAIYQDGYSEIMRLINTLNEVYHLEMAPVDENHPTSIHN